MMWILVMYGIVTGEAHVSLHPTAGACLDALRNYATPVFIGQQAGNVPKVAYRCLRVRDVLHEVMPYGLTMRDETDFGYSAFGFSAGYQLPLSGIYPPEYK